MSLYSFKTDDNFDKKIDDILVSIPRGSRSSFIKDALIYYIEQAENGMVRTRYIEKINDNMQNLGVMPQHIAYMPPNFNSNVIGPNNNQMADISFKDDTEDISTDTDLKEDDIEQYDDNDNEGIEIEGNDNNLDIFG